MKKHHFHSKMRVIQFKSKKYANSVNRCVLFYFVCYLFNIGQYLSASEQLQRFSSFSDPAVLSGIHSFLRASTGLELAAFAAWKITVITAKTKANAAERAKTPKPKGIL